MIYQIQPARIAGTDGSYREVKVVGARYMEAQEAAKGLKGEERLRNF